MDTLEAIGVVVGIIVGLGTIAGAMYWIYHWFRTWKIIKLKELDRLKGIEAEHQKCEAEKKRLGNLDNAFAREIRAQLGKQYEPPKVEVEPTLLGLGKDKK